MTIYKNASTERNLATAMKSTLDKIDNESIFNNIFNKTIIINNTIGINIVVETLAMLIR